MVIGKKPLVFFFLLFSLGVFIVGIRYGQYITYFDKAYVPAPSPLPTYTPFPTQHSKDVGEFVRYINEECGVSLVIPAYMNVNESSLSARFTKDDEDSIATMSCEKEIVLSARNLFLDLESAGEEYFNGEGVSLYEAPGNNLRWILRTQSKGKYILFSAPPSLVPLIFETVRLF